MATDTIEPHAFTCVVCHFDIPFDDVERAAGSIICFACYSRETGTAKPMPKALRKTLIAVLASLP